MRVARMGTERPDATHHGIQTAQYGAHVAGDIVRNALLVRREPKRGTDGLVKTLDVLLLRQ
jgi:hypothetical protein